VQDLVLAMLTARPSHGYELQLRLQAELGPTTPTLNAGQIYVTLGRLERAGLVTIVDRPHDGGQDRKIYELTPAGHERVQAWLDAVGWPRPALAEFHLKVALAARSGLADPIEILDRHRREVMSRLRQAQQAQLVEPSGSSVSLLLEGLILRLDAELRWLDAIENHWERPRSGGKE
jgi:DNA-binding PadR family transcriptional regulator